jgi:hypothetical protein
MEEGGIARRLGNLVSWPISQGEMAGAISIAALEERFTARPGEGLREVKQQSEAGGEAFRQAAARWLAGAADGRFARVLLHQLRAGDENLEQLLFQEQALGRGEAAQLARLACRVEPKLQSAWLAGFEMAEERWRSGGSTMELVRRLEVLGECLEAGRLKGLLARLVEHPAARVRAKAVEWSYRRGEGGVGLEDSNARVRASALEGMWGRQDEAAVEVFERHLRSENTREALNAVLGLHRAGEMRARLQLMDWTESADERRRRAAWWAIGHTQDPRLWAFAQERRGGALPGSFLGAVRRLREFVEASQKAGETGLEVFGLRRAGGRVIVSVAVERDEVLAGLRPTAFRVKRNGEWFDQWRGTVKGKREATDWVLLMPAGRPPVGWDSMEDVWRRLRSEDRLAVVGYPGAGSGSGVAVMPTVDFLPGVETWRREKRGVRLGGVDWEGSLGRALQALGGRQRQKQLLVWGDPQAAKEQAPVVGWSDRLKRLGVRPQVVMRQRVPAAVEQAWREACEEAGGSWRVCPAPVELGRVTEGVLLEVTRGVELECEMGAGKAELEIELYSRQGWGRAVARVR